MKSILFLSFVLLFSIATVLASPTREIPGTTVSPALSDDVPATTVGVNVARQDNEEEEEEDDEDANATTVSSAPVEAAATGEEVAEEDGDEDSGAAATERDQQEVRATTLRTTSTTVKVAVPTKTSFQQEWAIVTGLGAGGSSQPQPPPAPSKDDDNDEDLAAADPTQRSTATNTDPARQDINETEDNTESQTEQENVGAGVTEASSAPVVRSNSTSSGQEPEAAIPSEVPSTTTTTTTAASTDEDEDEDDEDEVKASSSSPSPTTTTTSAPKKAVPPPINTTNFEKEWSFVTGDEVLSDPQARAGCECGKVPFSVPGGGVNEWPWTAAIVRSGVFAGGRPHCGATLINSKFVLTAAHCVDGLLPFRTEVWLTVHDNLQSTGASSGTQRLLVDRILMHPNYNRRSGENDIALVAFSDSISIGNNNYFVPACVPAGRNDYSGIMGKMAAWGSSDLGPSNTRIKNNRICKADMPILSNDVCDRDTSHTGKITKNMMCAGYITPSNSLSCVSDAGGGLVISNGGRHTVVGIASFGYSPNRAYSPTVHTRVSEYAEWILHNTRDADWCD